MSVTDPTMDFEMERNHASENQGKRKFSPCPEDAAPRTRQAESDPLEGTLFAPTAFNTKSSTLAILERPSKVRDLKDIKDGTPVRIKAEKLEVPKFSTSAVKVKGENPEVSNTITAANLSYTAGARIKVEKPEVPSLTTAANANQVELFTFKTDTANPNQSHAAGESRPAPEDRSIKPPRILIVSGAEPGTSSWLDLSRCRVPTDKEIQAAFKTRRDLADNLVRHSLFLDWIIENSPPIATLCEERFAVHWGTIRARFDRGTYLTSMSPNRFMPKERLLVELQVRRDPKARISIAIVSPPNPAKNYREVYGWMIQNAPINRIGFAHILELAATGHAIHGYIVPGDSFEVNTVPAFRLEDDDESYENIEAEGEAKPRLRFKMTIDSVCFVVHYGADCPASIDLGGHQPY